MGSIWGRENRIPARERLERDLETEIAVIGGGMAGLLTAYFLSRQNKKVVVLEADRIAGGQTKNTTAKITSQHGMIYSELEKKHSLQTARLYAGANENAIHMYEQLIEEEGISCGFEKLPSYLYSRVSAEPLKKEAEMAAELGIKAFFTTNTELPFPNEGAVCFEEQAQFHPLEFIRYISKDLEIYENTKVLSVKGHVIHTECGTVTAEHIVFASHYPFLNIPGFYFLRQHQERSYVLALADAASYKGMYCSADEGGISLRNAGELLLFGGSSHRTGKNCCRAIYESLANKAELFYPGCREAARWSAQDCMTHDKIPFIGKYSVYRPYWYVATGFKKWGMTSSMISARLLTDLICKTENPYMELFRPQRFCIRASAKDFLVDAGESIRGLFEGALHPAKRCPHMGCEMKWNPDEQSWDCPCHGSRITFDGKLIDNPAQKGKF
ncbi:MAG: FAD-dependent oxidoreductase [Roseburia sp.]|nr:FAD-dependent oxidoreductase [Roseburia sp.]